MSPINLDSDGDGLPDGCDAVFCPTMDETIIGTACEDECHVNTIHVSCMCIPMDQIAPLGTVTMSSQFNGTLVGENLIDGVINNINSDLAHTSANSINEWIELDLGANYMISAVAIKNRMNSCSERLSNAYVMVSSTPFPNNIDLIESLATAEFIYQNGNTQGVEHIGMDVNMSGRYVRIQKSGNNVNGNALNLRELEVFTEDTSPILIDEDSDGVCDLNDVCPAGDDTA